MRQIQWRERFNIGVEQIDRAHRQLFTIVQKIMSLYVERHEDKFACVEGIKYFKAYALRHFAEEEAYMRQIGYPGYAAHKRLHDKMRLETLPELELLLYQSDFSVQVVQRFIGVCTGWLTGHILIEDRAITGAGPEIWPDGAHEDRPLAVHERILLPLRELLGGQLHFIGDFSAKDVILNQLNYELDYSAPGETRLRIVLVTGRQTLLRAAGLLFGMDFYEPNDIVGFAMQEIAQNLLQRAAASFGLSPDGLQLRQGRFLTREEVLPLFQRQPPQHSLLFRWEGESFALCIRRDQGPDSPDRASPDPQSL